VNISELRRDDLPELQEFFAALPEGDRTFIKEDVLNPQTLQGWVDGQHGGRRWLGRDEGGRIIGFLAVLPLLGWSSHVGEVRIVVAPDARGCGLGEQLARHALVQALQMGLSKLMVEVVAVQERAIGMFTRIGFQGEALLRDHIRDRSGNLQDLILLAHFVEDTWSRMATVGLEETVGQA
jgi:ribosomal protein S18 acetylase RimI-like enzyme